MLTQTERIKIRSAIEEKIAAVNATIMQWESNRSADAMMFTPGHEKKDADTVLRQQKVKLALLEQALSSVGQDWYGKCNRCGNAIPVTQLLTSPEVTKCPYCLK